MKSLLFSLLLLSCGPAQSSGPPTTSTGLVSGERVARWTFDEDLPEGFEASVGEWKIHEGHLAQDAENGASAFNIILTTDMAIDDVELSVRLTSVSGQIDQGGGLVWRAQDAANYYVARFNPLEDNFRVYTVVDGQRSQLATATVEEHEEWDSMRIVMMGDHIRCYLNGRLHLDVHDGTFVDAGEVGLWTKADARTLFDDLNVQNADSHE